MEEDGLAARAVRDLAWALFSPALTRGNRYVSSIPGWDLEAAQPWLQALVTDPSPLHAFLSPRSSRLLGKYFEALLSFALTNHPRFVLLGENLPVRIEKQTLGEIDFVYRDEATGQIVHLEVAVKFYLGFPREQPHSWLGPNPRDQLAKKISRMETHQGPLLRQDATKNLRHTLGIDEHREALLVKGRLFLPEEKAAPLPAVAAPDGLRGSWYYAKEAADALGTEPWLHLPKSFWLAPLSPADVARLRAQKATFFPGQTPVRRPSQLWQEGRYVFLVPDTWPGKVS